MCWTTVRNNCRILLEANVILGNKKDDRRMLIQMIADEFPHLSRMKITFAVDKYYNCMAKFKSPNCFVEFVQQYLKY